jgi:cell division protein FtsI (penicillin-binding protein 3)
MTAPARANKAASRSGSTERTQQAAQKTGQKSGQKPAQKSSQKAQKSAQKTTEKPRTRSAAAERAYARREERRDRSAREPSGRRPRQVRQGVEERRPAAGPKPKTRAKQLQERVSLARLPLVVVVMSVLATGLASTLWLSIAAVSGSYQLQQGEDALNELTERKERLLRDVSSMSSTPEIQRRAEEAGLRPAPSPARLVQQPDGSVVVVGEPKKATAAPPPAPPPAAENPAVQAPPAENPAQQQADAAALARR